MLELHRRRVLALAGTAVAAVYAPRSASAAEYPNKPVKIIVPVGAGGANDTATRLMAQKLSESLGQTFYVENMVGGGGNIAMGTAARAAPDGSTAVSVASSFVINPNLYAHVPYDPVKDFAPVCLMCSTATLVAVNPSVPAHSIQELVELLKANPGRYSYASAGTGTPAHLAGELFKVSYGVDITHVPFTGGSPAMTATLGDHTQIIFPALATAVGPVKAGKLRALAVMSARRSAALPDVPTMAELGASDQEADVIVGMLVPSATPKPVVDVLNAALVKALGLADVRERLAVLGFEPVASTPDEFAAWIKNELAKWGRVIREAKIPRI